MSVQLSYKEGVLTARLSGEIDHQRPGDAGGH